MMAKGIQRKTKLKKNLAETSQEKCDEQKNLNEAQLASTIRVTRRSASRLNAKYAKSAADNSGNINKFHCHMCNDTFTCDTMLKKHDYVYTSKHNFKTSVSEDVANLVKKRGRPKKYNLRNQSDTKIIEPTVHTAPKESNDSTFINNENALTTLKRKRSPNRFKRMAVSTKNDDPIKSKELPENVTQGVIVAKRESWYFSKRKQLSICGEYTENINETIEEKHLTKILRPKTRKNSLSQETKIEKRNNNLNKELSAASNVVSTGENNITKNLVIPLTKIDDLPSSKISQLISASYWNENYHKDSRNEVDNNIQSMEYTVYKQYKQSCTSERTRKGKNVTLKVESTQKCKTIQNKLDSKKILKRHSKYVINTNVKKVKTVNIIPSKKTNVGNSEHEDSKSKLCENNIPLLSNVKKNTEVDEEQLLLAMNFEKTNETLALISQRPSLNNVTVHQDVVLKEQYLNCDTNVTEKHQIELEKLNFRTNVYKTGSENDNNTTVTLSEKIAAIPKVTEQSQNVLHYFMEQKKNLMNKNKRKGSKRKKLRKCKGNRSQIKSILAMCSKCQQAFRLLQQLQDKVNFVKDEKVLVECTLCNLQITSLLYLQEHIMEVHLQCEAKISNAENKFSVDIINIDEILNSESNDTFNFECCCCLKAFDNLHDLNDHISNVHCNLNYPADSIKQKTKVQIIENTKSCTIYEAEKVVCPENENAIKATADSDSMIKLSGKNKNCEAEVINYINTQITGTRQKTVKNCENCGKGYIYSGNLSRHKKYCNRNINSNLDNHDSNGNINSNLDNHNSSMKVETTTLANKRERVKYTYINHTVQNRILKRNQNMRNSTAQLKYSDVNNTIGTSGIVKENNPKLFIKRRAIISRLLFRKSGFSHICRICFKTFKQKCLLKLHFANHFRNRNSNKCRQLKKRRLLKTDFNATKYVNRFKSKQYALTSNLYVMNTPKHSVIQRTDNNITSTRTNMHWNEMTQDENDYNTCVIKNQNFVQKTDSLLNRNYILYTQTSKQDLKKRKSFKLNLNVKKQVNTDYYKEQAERIDFECKFPNNLETNINFTLDKNKESLVTFIPKEMCCNICHKTFNTQRSLNEHMFYLHDSVSENAELPNLLMPYFNGYEESDSTTMEEIEEAFEKILNISPKTDMSQSMTEEEDERENGLPCGISYKSNCTIRKNKKWRCNLCKENFALIRNFLRHKYYIHKDESVVHICDNCSKVLTSVAMVNIHMCSNVTSWNCKRCNLSFPNGKCLTEHNINFHFESVGPHICDLCKQSFLTRCMLEKHKRKHFASDNYIRGDALTEYTPPVKNIGQSYNLDNFANIRSDLKNPNLMGICWLPELNDLPVEKCSVSNFIYFSLESEELFKCKLCNLICLTTLQMKHHLLQHKIVVHVCQLCTNLVTMNGLAKHLIIHHIALDAATLGQNKINTSIKSEENYRNSLVEVLGFKRLLSLFEYQRYDTLEAECFPCESCSKDFSNVQYYKAHYLENHDLICLLCNTEFENCSLAMDHKVKIHTLDSYFWALLTITNTILQSNECGNSLENAILKFSEMRTD